MKKMILVISIATAAWLAGNAQEIHIGAKAGLNMATIQPDLNDPATRTSFHLGGVVEIPITDIFSVQPELLYSSQGVKDKSDDDEMIKLDYLSLPVLAKYYVWNALSVEAGPQFGILLSAEREDDGETVDLKDASKSTDIGFALGLGYKLENGFNLAARYYFGSDINAAEEGSNKVKNRVFQISVGYFFN